MKDETTPTTLGEAFNMGIEKGLEFNAYRQKRTRIVCNRIKNLRLSRDITQSELCSAIDINKITYSGYENCRAEPTMEVLVRIADYYNVSLDYIAGRTENKIGLYAGTDNAPQQKLDQLQKIEEMQKQLDNLKAEIRKTN